MVKPQFANSKMVIEEVTNRLKNAGLEILQAEFVRYDEKHAKQH